jgi:hypothetical protein
MANFRWSKAVYSHLEKVHGIDWLDDSRNL